MDIIFFCIEIFLEISVNFPSQTKCTLKNSNFNATRLSNAPPRRLFMFILIFLPEYWVSPAKTFTEPTSYPNNASRRAVNKQNDVDTRKSFYWESVF